MSEICYVTMFLDIGRADWKNVFTRTLDQYLKDGGQTCNAARVGWGCSTAGAKLKIVSGWDGNNSSSFTALPAGFRSTNGSFYDQGTGGIFWSSSINGSHAWYRVLDTGYSTVDRHDDDQELGFSVRCIQD